MVRTQQVISLLLIVDYKVRNIFDVGKYIIICFQCFESCTSNFVLTFHSDKYESFSVERIKYFYEDYIRCIITGQWLINKEETIIYNHKRNNISVILEIKKKILLSCTFKCKSESLNIDIIKLKDGDIQGYLDTNPDVYQGNNENKPDKISTNTYLFDIGRYIIIVNSENVVENKQFFFILTTNHQEYVLKTKYEYKLKLFDKNILSKVDKSIETQSVFHYNGSSSLINPRLDKMRSSSLLSFGSRSTSPKFNIKNLRRLEEITINNVQETNNVVALKNEEKKKSVKKSKKKIRRVNETLAPRESKPQSTSPITTEGVNMVVDINEKKEFSTLQGKEPDEPIKIIEKPIRLKVKKKKIKVKKKQKIESKSNEEETKRIKDEINAMACDVGFSEFESENIELRVVQTPSLSNSIEQPKKKASRKKIKKKKVKPRKIEVKERTDEKILEQPSERNYMSCEAKELKVEENRVDIDEKVSSSINCIIT